MSYDARGLGLVNQLSQPRHDAVSVGISQDASKGWLVLRYSSSNDRLSQGQGFVGAVHMPSKQEHLHARAIKQATEQALSDLACPTGCFPGYRGKHVKRTAYTKFLPQLLPKIEAVTADGAPDEQLSLTMLCGSKLPNVLMTCKDLAHSMRRVASRTCFADPCLKRLPLG